MSSESQSFAPLLYVRHHLKENFRCVLYWWADTCITKMRIWAGHFFQPMGLAGILVSFKCQDTG